MASENGGLTMRCAARLLLLSILWSASVQSEPARQRVLSAAWASGRTAYALLDTFDVYRSDDAGQSWQLRGRIPPPHPDYLLDLFLYWPRLTALPGSSELVLASLGDALWRSGDGGRNWTLASDRAGGALLTDAARPDRVLSADDGRLQLSEDGGRTWREFGQVAGRTYDLARDGVEPDVLYLSALCGHPAVDSGYGCLYISRDGGRTWLESELSGITGAWDLETRAGVPGTWGAFRTVAYAPQVPNYVSRVLADESEERIFQSEDRIWAIAHARHLGQSHLIMAVERFADPVLVLKAGELQRARGIQGTVLVRMQAAPDDAALVLGTDPEGRIFRSENGGLDWQDVRVVEGVGGTGPIAVPANGALSLLILIAAIGAGAWVAHSSFRATRS